MPEAIFHPEFRNDLQDWAKWDPVIARRVLSLVGEILSNPASGSGRPVPLKGVLEGCLSRRLTLHHRLVYLVRGDRVHFLEARYHY